jgi:hypothetical protein
MKQNQKGSQRLFEVRNALLDKCIDRVLRMAASARFAKNDSNL